MFSSKKRVNTIIEKYLEKFDSHSIYPYLYYMRTSKRPHLPLILLGAL